MFKTSKSGIFLAILDCFDINNRLDNRFNGLKLGKIVGSFTAQKSVPSEKVFFVCGKLLTQDQFSMKHQSLDNLTFLIGYFK